MWRRRQRLIKRSCYYKSATAPTHCCRASSDHHSNVMIFSSYRDEELTVPRPVATATRTTGPGYLFLSFLCSTCMVSSSMEKIHVSSDGVRSTCFESAATIIASCWKYSALRPGSPSVASGNRRVLSTCHSSSSPSGTKSMSSLLRTGARTRRAARRRPRRRR